jgi:hypothetical protein
MEIYHLKLVKILHILQDKDQEHSFSYQHQKDKINQ